MIQPVELAALGSKGLKVLCVGAHADDIEIGCGGTMLRLVRNVSDLQVRWEVFSGNPTRRAEAKASARQFLNNVRSPLINTASFRESFFPEQWAAIKRRFQEIAASFEPDVVFTHARDDRHQDHRVLWELTWNTFRNHLILEYEIPKYEGDLGQPNLFISLPEALCERKIQLLGTCFKSQRRKHWFSAETFRGLMRIRGVEAAAPYAEAFYARKAVL